MIIERTNKNGNQVSLTGSGDYYISNENAISEIVAKVSEGSYCTILGPHYCEKSLLLADIKKRFDALGHQVCVLLDLDELRALPDADLLPSFAKLVFRSLQEQGGIKTLPLLAEVSDEKSLQLFFQDLLHDLKSELVLLIDHLERIRMGPLESLLRTLRAIYNERGLRTSPRLGVVTASSLSVAALALGPTSPFNIARIVLVRDLAREESEELVKRKLQQNEVEIDRSGLDRLLWAANGDRYLLRQLCRKLSSSSSVVSEPEAARSIDWMVEVKAGQCQPFINTVHALEDDPQNLMNIIKILKASKAVPRRDLDLGLEEVVDKLQLTGAISVEQKDGEKLYEVRNEIYYRFLRRHFSHSRVVHVLGIHGEWEQAINYLEQLIPTNPEYRSALLGTILDSIYAARNESEAYHPLAHRLGRAFYKQKVRIYVANAERTRLSLISHVGFESEPTTHFRLDQASPEVEAYFSNKYVTLTGDGGESVFYTRVLRDQWQPLCVVAIHDLNPQSSDFHMLQTFLKQVGRALGNVIQLTSLFETGKQITNSLDLEKIMQSTVDEAIKAVPNAQRGALFVWNEKEQGLLVGAQRGYRESIKKEIKLGKGQGYVGIVHSTGEPLRMGNVLNDPRTLLKNDVDIKKAKSVICVPLKAWDQVIGVLCLDNMIVYDAFQQSNLWLLAAFADQAASALQNARLYSELLELWEQINQGNLDFQEIFLRVVQSITRVTKANAANMLLLSKTDLPKLSVSQKPDLSVSAGLKKEYDDEIRPRPDGLTYQVLTQGQARAVRSLDDPPGINPVARALGTQAYICVPMKVQDRIIGVLFVHYDKSHDFSSNEVEILSLFANLTAQAITNKRLLDQAKNQFRYLAHATITPLAAIGFLIEELYAHNDPVKVDRAYRVIKITLADLNTNLKNNLAMARPDINMLQPDIKQFNLSRLVNDTVNLFIPEAEDKGISLVKRADGADIVAWGDPSMVTQVLHNLVKNALFAFTDQHKGEKIVEMAIQKTEDDTIVIVSDNGVGIPLEKQMEVFKRFYSSSKRAGIGLTISRMIAQLHQGSLTLESEAGAGSKFYFVLPDKE